MRKFWPCCRKSNTWPQAHDPEPEIDPEPEPDPEPAPEPDPDPAPEPCSKGLKTDAQETDLKELKTPHHFTQLSIVCMESRKRINTPASSADTLDSSVCVQSDRSNAETIINIMERARRGEKSFLDNSEQKICFLRAISASCMAARESGQDTLNLPYSKDELAEAIVLVARTLPIHSVPPAILS